MASRYFSLSSIREIDKLLSLFTKEEKQSLDYAVALALQAAIYSGLGRNAEAIDIKEESIRLKLHILGPNHVEVTTA